MLNHFATMPKSCRQTDAVVQQYSQFIGLARNARPMGVILTTVSV